MPDPIFLVGRFRSGTTMLWSWFDRDPSCMAFYEPLHDNLIEQIHAVRPTASHRGIADYWSAYRDLGDELKRFFRASFGMRHLMLDADSDYPELEQYLGFLIRAARDRRPVFKFNRADFRLSWLRRKFPEAIIVYLQRDARDTWVSARRHLPETVVNDADATDAFDLFQWSVALADSMPFLWSAGIDSYLRHYYLWRLSAVAGQRCADVHLQFEPIIANPEEALAKFVAEKWISEESARESRQLVDTEQRSAWRGIQPSAWFEERESTASETLGELGLLDAFSSTSFAQIRDTNREAWDRLPQLPIQRILDQLLAYASDRRNEVTRLLGEISRQNDLAGQ